MEWLTAAAKMVGLLATVATAVGVFLAYLQIRVSSRQAITTFEDGLTEQYRAIIRNLPIEALLGEPLSDGLMKESLPAFYQYFDLSNEQAFLFSRGRVRRLTWLDWEEGIRQSAQLPAFMAAWREIRGRCPSVFDNVAAILGEPGPIRQLPN